MNDEQNEAAIRSLAEELSRLAHSWPEPEDDDEEFIDESVHLAHIMRVVQVLCGPQIAGLAKLVTALRKIHDHGAEERTPEH
jgi:hypothetical protein